MSVERAKFIAKERNLSLSESIRHAALEVESIRTQQTKAAAVHHSEAESTPLLGTAMSERPAGRWCPEETASWPSKMFFSWIDGLIGLGQSKTLQPDDLWDMAEVDEAEAVFGQFRRHFDATVTPETPHGQVVRSLWTSFGRTFVFAGLLKFTHDLLMLLGPIILQNLLKVLQEGRSKKTAFGLAFAMFATASVQTVIVNQYFHILFRISLHMKVTLVHLLYRKSLKVTSAVRSGLGVGPIVNLQSNDASKLWNLVPYLHVIWSAPFQILVVLVLLCRVVHVIPAFAGVFVTLTLIPINAVVSKQIGKMRKEMLQYTDRRVKLVTEVVTGIKALKLYAWEEPYVQKIKELREQELALIRRTAYWNIVNLVFFSSGPIFVALACFGVHAALGYRLTASVAFPALALFNLLRFPILMLPSQIMNIIQAQVALKRLQHFLDQPEVKQPPVRRSGSAEVVLSIRNGTFNWGTPPQKPPAGPAKGSAKPAAPPPRPEPPKAPAPVLHDINIEIPRGKLLMVVGEVGAGKSSLIAALLGELQAASPDARVEIAGSVAYTAQDPWIQNMTMRDNILMGKEMDEDKYDAVLEACALAPDLEMLPAGDLTEIGEKGVNLSGGQKHRVALARAVYADADVYLFDDPLSAVDVHVGQHLFHECIRGRLGGKTVVLVTHQLQYLPHADLVIVMSDGRVQHSGTYEECSKMGIDFHQFEAKAKKSSPSHEAPSEAKKPAVPNGLGVREASMARRGGAKLPDSDGKLVKKEGRAEGSVKKSVYLAYVSAWSPMYILPIAMCVFACTERGLQVGQNYWLSTWSNAMDALSRGVKAKPDGYYLGIYVALGMSSVVLLILRSFCLVVGSNEASRTMQNRLLTHVVRLPMSFFDSQPTGRLLNRFTKDVESVDMQVSQSVSSFITCLISVVGSVIVVVSVTPGVLSLIVPLSYFYYKVQQAFIATSRETKRLDSLAFSPIFGHFNESLQGLLTIRAFRRQEDFDAKNVRLLNGSNRAYWPIMAVNRWLSVRIEMVGNFTVFGAAVFVSVLTQRNAGLAGLALTSALNVTGFMNWMVRQVTDLEINMNSVERMIEYESFPTEAPAIIQTTRPPSDWPSQGGIIAQNLTVKYRPELDPVLKGLSFTIKGREKVGVCGRTGCGKSTLMMAIYRIVEPTDGRVLIDGIDTSVIGLQDLRSRLALVPQDPIIFSGSVRSNLDPFDQIKDDQTIWKSLERAGMDRMVRALDKGLDSPIIEGGQNLSVGQRQLLCMARALLRGSRIMIMDEATSNVDHQTDAIIQGTIREAFKDCTVLTIAHRLNTIIDSDKILVLEAGTLKEFDSPTELLKKTTGHFYQLVASAGGLGMVPPAEITDFSMRKNGANGGVDEVTEVAL